MGKETEMTLKEYAKKRKVAVSGIRRNITKGWTAPGVKKAKKVGTTWLLTVDEDRMKKGVDLEYEVIY